MKFKVHVFIYKFLKTIHSFPLDTISLYYVFCYINLENSIIIE